MVLNLHVEDLRFAFAGGPPLLEGVSFALCGGEVLCLLGPNGSGKTTLLRCVLGLEPLGGGRVRLDGKDLVAATPLQRARRMAYVPQGSAATFPFTAFDVALMGRSAHLRFMADPNDDDRRIARAALERLEVRHLERRPFHELSGGERQLVLIARALAQQAPLLVMDEPCAGLDLGHQVQVLQALLSLAGEGYAILLSTHSPDHAFWLDAQVALLAAGRWLGPGSADAMLTAPQLSRLYGTPVALCNAAGQRVVVPLMSDPRRSHDIESPPATAAEPVRDRAASGRGG